MPTSKSMEGFSFLILSSCLFSILIICNGVGADTLSPTQFLSDGNTTVVSSGGTFELGFFSPGNPGNRYLGIWYKKISTPTVVWVANRDIPLTDKSGVLRVTNQGILTLVNSTSNVIWSSNSSRSTQNPIAQLLDSGNLVVKDGGNDVVWQSFDHPTDTLLPGMKLGRNLVTGLDRYLTSWKSTNDPSPGDFTCRLDPRGLPQLVLLNGSDEIYGAGPWTGLRFSGSQGLKPNPIYTYGLVLNKEEVYYGFELVNTSVYSKLQVGNGVVQRFTWNYRSQSWNVYLSMPVDNCDNYALCHAYGSCNIVNSPVCGCLDKFVPRYPADWENADWSNGCVRRTPLPLDCHNGHGFLKYSGMKLPDTRYSWFDQSMTLDECRKVCLENCSCTAYANSDVREGGSGCLLWFGDLIDSRVLSENGQDFYVRMAASELNSTGPQVGSNNKKGHKIILVLPLLAASLLLGLSLTLYIWKRKKRQQKREGERRRMGHGSEQFYGSENQKDDLELPLFDLATISTATNDFSLNNKLGEGGFGPVYKGMLKEGQEIAVKRLSMYSSQGRDEFKNEVICIAKLQHRNLVKLLGCCIEGEEKMLIYEYMPNSSLDSFIFDQTRSTLLDWPKRFSIINGIARGLLYLHQDSRLRIIHRDLKASNILLDIDMNPKISDFGMARSFRGNETEANTRRIVGTYGYMSPEYAVDGIFSTKSDVFSFGVLVLEIVSGKKNRGFFHPDHHHNLIGHAWILYKEGRSSELIDSQLGDSCYLYEVLRSIVVGLLCVQQCPEDRPSMSSVVLMLGSEGALPKPTEPGFFTKRNLLFEVDYSSSNCAAVSANEMSITQLDAR